MGSSDMLSKRGRTLNECSCPLVCGLPKVMREGGAWYFFHYLQKFMQTFFKCMTH